MSLFLFHYFILIFYLYVINIAKLEYKPIFLLFLFETSQYGLLLILNILPFLVNIKIKFYFYLIKSIGINSFKQTGSS